MKVVKEDDIYSIQRRRYKSQNIDNNIKELKKINQNQNSVSNISIDANNIEIIKEPSYKNGIKKELLESQVVGLFNDQKKKFKEDNRSVIGSDDRKKKID